MKVLYDHQIFAAQKFGGISRYFSEISNPILDGVDTEIINHLDFPNFHQNLFSKGIRFAKNKLKINYLLPENLFPQIPIDRLIKNDFDIFHPTYYDPYFFPHIKKPFVLTVYDMIHELYPEYFGLDESICVNKRFLCEKADLILAISETTKKDLIQIYNIDESKIQVTYLGSDFDKVKPIRPLVNSEIENFILFTGSRGIYKNFYFMLRALVDFMINDKSLKLVCTGHPFSEMELNYFKKLGIDKNIFHVYANLDNELAWLYQNALFFIFPSLYEGFGIPILEAFASKCPVISSNGGSLKEIGGKGVRFFNPKCIMELQDAVSDLMFNSETRQNLIHNGLIELEKYSWEKCRKETNNAYKSLV
jgi:glycosyltransferase involved in cell wall biosynthesis